MDIVPLLFLLIIIFGSGVIALFADNLGRKLGKKRLWLKWRFLHLRPKHTAQAGVFLSGVIVSFLTIMIVAGLSSAVRTWIWEGRHALVVARIAKKEVGDLKAEGERLVDANTRLRDSVKAGDLKLKGQSRTIDAQQKTLDAQTAQITEGTARVKDLQAKLDQGSAKIKDLDRKLASNAREYKIASDSLTKARQGLQKGRLALAKVLRDQKVAVTNYNDILDRNTKIENQNRVLENSVASLKADTKRLDEERAALDGARQKVQADLDETLASLGATQDKLAQAQDTLRTVMSQYEIDSRFVKTIGSTFKQAREAPITYKRGEEVARVFVPADASPEDAKKAVEALLRSSRAMASARGAQSVGDYDAADIVAHYDPQMDRTIPAADIRDSLSRQLAGKPEPQLIVGASSLNAFAGEPVSLEVAIFPNPLVYKQGQVVAEARVDGRQEPAEIYRTVLSQLPDRLTERARKDRMIPRAGTDADFGSLTAEEILDVVDRVHKADRKVILRAMADTDTRAGDPLRLRFGIR